MMFSKSSLPLTLAASAIVGLLLMPTASMAQEDGGAAAEQDPFAAATIDDIGECSMSSLDLSALDASTQIDPCILHDIVPDEAADATKTTDIAIVQVTPTGCKDHRDGAVTAVEKINADNDGQGYAIGSNGDHFIRFRLMSVVAGNPAVSGDDAYAARHESILNSMIESLNAMYIIGSCSFYATMDKEPSFANKRMVMAQIGPPGYYVDQGMNAYVFGIHVNSDTYPLPPIEQLKAHVESDAHPTDEMGLEAQPVRVVTRTASEFFLSTCTSATNEALASGFTDTIKYEYDPAGDDDGNGVLNSDDVDFLKGLADEACPPGSGEPDNHDHPALFACLLTDTEAQAILGRWIENGCKPSMLWLTMATWGWANDNLETIPYYLGGGQWHSAFSYADKYFPSGQAVLDYNADAFGYSGGYDQVVSYAIPVLYAMHIESMFSNEAIPDVLGMFNTDYDGARDAMKALEVDTIFGPVKFNEVQRNIGRGAAESQWLPVSDGESDLQGACVSPPSEAQEAMVLPAPSSQYCMAGQHIDKDAFEGAASILTSKCVDCPAGTFTVAPNEGFVCNACLDGIPDCGDGPIQLPEAEPDDEPADEPPTSGSTALAAGMIGFAAVFAFVSFILVV